jgi:hypothetical protein
MKNILQNAMESSGIYKWADENTKRHAENIAARGLYGGVQQAQMGMYEDKAASAKLEQQKAAYDAMLKNLGNNSFGGTKDLNGTIPINTIPINTPNYDQKSQQTLSKNSLNSLGIIEDKEGNFKDKKVTVNIDNPSNISYNMSTSVGVINANSSHTPVTVKLYNDNRLMTRTQFVS